MSSNKKPIIGLSGYIYKTNRKGENLIRGLLKHPIAESIKIVASGYGWPVKTVEYELDQLPDYFNSLDAYLCASNVEGIPIPVLEALACGKPVIVPRDVGIIDELPEHHFILRYAKNNLQSLVDAIEHYLSIAETITEIERLELRQIAEKYNSEQWKNDHLKVFENFLYNSHISQNKADLSAPMGIYYVAYGIPARECVERALISKNKYLPHIPACVVSDKLLDTEQEYIFIEYPDNDIGARNNKTMIYDLAPKDWQYVLYLDSDTEIASKDVEFIFNLLKDGFDFVICTNPENYLLVKDMFRPDNQDEMAELLEILGTDELLQYNGGVFAFSRNDRTEKLLKGWNSEWKKYGKRDQAALDRFLYQHPLRIYTLGVEWNTITRYYDKSRTAGILHYPMTARRWKGQIKGRLDQKESWAVLHPK